MGANHKEKRIWVTWEVQRRNKSLSGKLNATLFEIISKKNRFFKYPINSIRTLGIFIRENPSIIFAQNPSIVLALITIIYGIIRSTPVVIDAHNAGVHPLDGKSRLLNSLTKYLFRYASITIVSNKYLADHVTKQGGNPFALPDPLPDDVCVKEFDVSLKCVKSVVFICSWAPDEPYMEVIKALKLLPHDTTVVITGNSQGKILLDVSQVPDNMILTGFLPEKRYLSLLNHCDVIMDLTTREACLVCGAYEGIKLGKPLILSDTRINREYFSKGVIYTKNSAIHIAESINKAFTRLETLQTEIADLESEINRLWNADLASLEQQLEQLV